MIHTGMLVSLGFKEYMIHVKKDTHKLELLLEM